jgi:hypothetical protein
MIHDDTINNKNILMPTDYPSGASVQQPQSSPTVQTRVDVHSQSPKDMSIEQLALWLRNHPSLSGMDCEEDISKLIGTCNFTCVCSIASRS